MSASPNTLSRAVYDTCWVHGLTFMLVFICVFFIPTWLSCIVFYTVGAVFLTTALAPIIDGWKHRPRVRPHGKAVFITGCDSGFGYLLAQKLDALGLLVFAGCLFPKGEGAERLKKSASNTLQIVDLNVTSAESVEKAVQYVSRELKENELWAVVNNAGIADAGDLFWTRVDTIENVMNVNTMGVVRVTKAFLPLLTQFKGRVVTVTSASGRLTIPRMVPYCMSKCTTLSFCEGLRMEMYEFGVKVVTIEPFMYRTNLNAEDVIRELVHKKWRTAADEVKEHFPADYIDKYIDDCRRLSNNSSSDNLQEVLGCLEEAVMAKDPKYSYSPGRLHSTFIFWLLQRLPKSLVDKILLNAFR